MNNTNDDNFKRFIKFAYETTIYNYIRGIKGFPILDDDGQVVVESPSEEYQRIEMAVEWLLENDKDCSYKTKEAYMEHIRNSRAFNIIASNEVQKMAHCGHEDTTDSS